VLRRLKKRIKTTTKGRERADYAFYPAPEHDEIHIYVEVKKL
jgi:hypothetical protein